MAQTINLLLTNEGLSYTTATLNNGSKITLDNVIFSETAIDSSDLLSVTYNSLGTTYNNTCIIPVSQVQTQSSSSGTNSLLHILAYKANVTFTETKHIKTIILTGHTDNNTNLAYAAYSQTDDIYVYTTNPINISIQFTLAMSSNYQSTIEVTNTTFPIQYATTSDVGLVQLATSSQVTAGTTKSGEKPLVVASGAGFNLIDNNNNVILKTSIDNTTSTSLPVISTTNSTTALTFDCPINADTVSCGEINGGSDTNLNINCENYNIDIGEDGISISNLADTDNPVNFIDMSTDDGVSIGTNLNVNGQTSFAQGVTQIGPIVSSHSTFDIAYPVGCLFIGFALQGNSSTFICAGDTITTGPTSSTSAYQLYRLDLNGTVFSAVQCDFTEGNTFKALTTCGRIPTNTTYNALGLFVRLS